MVQIGLNSETAEIEIKMKIWALAQVMNDENWQKAIYNRCRELIDEEIEKRTKQANNQTSKKG
jgi:RecB family exonuclease